MSLLSPWLWLGFLLMLAGAGFTGYQQGVKITRAEYDAAAKAQLNTAIEKHNAQAKADRDAAVKAEQQRQDRRIKQMEAKHGLELEAARNHNPACSWTDTEQRLLNTIVDHANGRAKAPAANGVSDGVRPADAAAGNDGSGSEGVGWWGRIKLWGMQKPAQ